MYLAAWTRQVNICVTSRKQTSIHQYRQPANLSSTATWALIGLTRGRRWGSTIWAAGTDLLIDIAWTLARPDPKEPKLIYFLAEVSAARTKTRERLKGGLCACMIRHAIKDLFSNALSTSHFALGGLFGACHFQQKKNNRPQRALGNSLVCQNFKKAPLLE